VTKLLFGGAAILLLIGAGLANAGDSTRNPPPLAVQYDWSGFYGGVTAGGAWGQYDARSSTAGGSYLDAISAAAVNAAGAQSIRPIGFATGIEGGYNWQIGNLLLGVEADLQAASLNGATNSGAIPYPGTPAGRSFTVTSYGSTDWLFTARPRVGFVAPNHWLFYATGGLALTQLRSDFSFIDSVPGDIKAATSDESGKLDTVKAGYTAGAGVEAPLTERLSVKAEYLHVDFANTAGTVTENDVPAGQVFTHTSDFKADIVRAGLNYRFGGLDPPAMSDAIMSLKAPVWKAQPSVNTDWEVEAGARLWFSSGNVGAAQALLGYPPPPSQLVSRLIYSGLDSVSGETFARVDHASGIFVKGYLGGGGIDAGHLNDEDFPGDEKTTKVYSNTLLSASGQIDYATIDLGYNFLMAPGAKVGAFVGYNYYAQAINTHGCSQVAGDDLCVPASPPSLLVITENNNFNSVRVGLSSEVMVSDRLKLTADAAYVPWVSFTGLDDHLLRQLLLSQASSSGDGVMLEAVLDYNITNAWSVGVGGRYWAWNTNTGTEAFNFLTTSPTGAQLARYTSERYGMFAQTSYKWGHTTPTTEAPVSTVAPINWTGFHVGGNLGGGWSDDNWSDPFGSTPGGPGGTNVAGFGDRTHATGPLGGGQIGADWQIGRAVLGIQADANAANLRGENTCFTGLGGINCQHNVSALGTVTGRVGYAWDRSLVYVKGGGAWTATAYDLLGNTNILTLGTGSATLDTWGWTVGGGIEYALTNHWTALVEYDHIGLPATVVAFPTVATIDTATISVRQTVDLFKLGVNYKFNLASLGTIAARD
jgi:opacity protein-like surface antigen